MTPYEPLRDAHGAEGHRVEWRSHGDAGAGQAATIRWENEGYTIHGSAQRERVEFVLRLSPAWQVRQFLLFRDLEEPDLWLATDGHGRWGEMNGAHRVELDGCYDVALDCTPLTHTLPIRRLPLADGDTAEFPVAVVDVETLEVDRVTRCYTRIDSNRWSCDGRSVTVDRHGLVVEEADRYRRTSP